MWWQMLAFTSYFSEKTLYKIWIVFEHLSFSLDLYNYVKFYKTSSNCMFLFFFLPEMWNFKWFNTEFYSKIQSSHFLIFCQVRDRELYCDTDTEVKRQIWKDNQSLFGDEVSPLLSQYIKEKEHILFDHLNLTNLFFSPSPKVIIFFRMSH